MNRDKQLTQQEFDATMLIMRAKDLFNIIPFSLARDLTYVKYLAVRARFVMCEAEHKVVCLVDVKHDTTYHVEGVHIAYDDLTGNEEFLSSDDEYGVCNVDRLHRVIYEYALDEFEALIDTKEVA